MIMNMVNRKVVMQREGVAWEWEGRGGRGGEEWEKSGYYKRNQICTLASVIYHATPQPC